MFTSLTTPPVRLERQGDVGADDVDAGQANSSAPAARAHAADDVAAHRLAHRPGDEGVAGVRATTDLDGLTTPGMLRRAQPPLGERRVELDPGGEEPGRLRAELTAAAAVLGLHQRFDRTVTIADEPRAGARRAASSSSPSR